MDLILWQTDVLYMCYSLQTAPFTAGFLLSNEDDWDAGMGEGDVMS